MKQTVMLLQKVDLKKLFPFVFRKVEVIARKVLIVESIFDFDDSVQVQQKCIPLQMFFWKIFENI